MQNKTITKAEALAQLQGGVFGAFVEYRMSTAEVINWRDKATGKAMSAPIVRHTVETATASIAVAERVPDDFNVAAFKPTIKKGAKCFLVMSEYMTERGSVKARGELFPLSDVS